MLSVSEGLRTDVIGNEYYHNALSGNDYRIRYNHAHGSFCNHTGL